MAEIVQLVSHSNLTTRQPDILGRLRAEDREAVLKRSRRICLHDKGVLFRQGDLHDGIFFVESGLIRTYYTSPMGREMTLAFWLPGNFVGGPDVFGGSVHMWSGVAVVETEAIGIKGKDIRDLMERIPALAINIVEAQVFKGKWFSSLVQMLGTRSVSERLSHLLLTLCDLYGVREGDGIAIGGGFTHEDLANMVGASRQWVTTTLARFQRDGVLRIRKRQIVVICPDILRSSQG